MYLRGQWVLLILSCLNGFLRESVVSLMSYIFACGLLFSIISKVESISAWNALISSVSLLIIVLDIVTSFYRMEVHILLLPVLSIVVTSSRICIYFSQRSGWCCSLLDGNYRHCGKRSLVLSTTNRTCTSHFVLIIIDAIVSSLLPIIHPSHCLSSFLPLWFISYELHFHYSPEHDCWKQKHHIWKEMHTLLDSSRHVHSSVVSFSLFHYSVDSMHSRHGTLYLCFPMTSHRLSSLQPSLGSFPFSLLFSHC